MSIEPKTDPARDLALETRKHWEAMMANPEDQIKFMEGLTDDELSAYEDARGEAVDRQMKMRMRAATTPATTIGGIAEKLRLLKILTDEEPMGYDMTALLDGALADAERLGGES